MKSVKKALREGIYAALNGTISVPVYDGMGDFGGDAYVVISAISESPDNTYSSFRTEVVVDFDIQGKTGNSFSRDLVDDIENEILLTLIPDVETAGFSVSGFQVLCVQKQSSSYIDEPGRDFNTGNIVRNILRIRQILVQQ